MTLYSVDRARRSIIDTVAFRLVSQSATILSYIILARGLAPSSFGVLNLFYALIPLGLTLGSLGLDHTLRRFQPELVGQSDFRSAFTLMLRIAALRLAATVVLLAVLLLSWDLLAPIVDLQDYRPQFLLFAVIIVLHLQSLTLQYGLGAMMQHRYAVASVAMLGVGKLLGYLLLHWQDGFTIEAVIRVDLAAYLASVGVLVVGCVQTLRRIRGDSPEAGLADGRRRMRRYALFHHLTDTASLLQYSETDRYFVGARLDHGSVGAYAFYTRLGEMATSLIPQRLLDNVIQPMVFGVPLDEARERLPRYVTFLINTSLIYQLALVTFTAVYHADIVRLLVGDRYLDHSYLLPVVLAFATTDFVFSVPIHLVAQYRERAGTVLRSQFLGVFQVLGMLVLIPLLGILGAALASGTYHVVRNAYVWWRVRQEAVWINWRPALASSLLCFGIAAIVCVVLRNVAGIDGLPGMALGVPVIAAAVLAWLRGPAIAASDRQILGRLAPASAHRALQLLGLRRADGMQT